MLVMLCNHTFSASLLVCKSCLVQHLEENNTCPTCRNVIHQSHPLQYISFDRTMQDIVYKLVPDLQESKHIQFFVPHAEHVHIFANCTFVRNQCGVTFAMKKVALPNFALKKIIKTSFGLTHSLFFTR
jgi:hypothetical protein